MTAERTRRILIVRFGSMGDIVHGLPVLAALKETFPSWEVDWLVERRWRELLEGIPQLRRVIVFDTLAWRAQAFSWTAWSDLRQAVGALRARRYDCALDLQGSLKSAVACFLSGAAEIIGLEQPWLKEPAGAVLYTRRVRTDATHIVEANLSLACALGAHPPSIHFPLPEGNPDSLPADLPLDGLAVLNPGAGWRSKCWAPEGYAQVCDFLETACSLPAVLNIGPGEEGLARQVQAACRVSQPRVYAGSVSGLIALLRRARIMIAPDTGPLHLAAALGVPSVGLFGPTDPRRNGPYGGSHRALRPENARTSYQHAAGPDQAMDQIHPEQVVSAVRELLDAKHETPGADRPLAALAEVPCGQM